MKVEVPIVKEVEITTVRLDVAVRYEEEQIPNDFPGRNGEMLTMHVDIDTGRIRHWPAGKTFDLHMKVCDCGTYRLLDAEGVVIAIIENDYVPHGVVPGSYGDYLEFDIGEDGVIKNWPTEPDVSSFFKRVHRLRNDGTD